jgi:hypothetical protein
MNLLVGVELPKVSCQPDTKQSQFAFSAKQPLVVNYGGGRDSTAMLVGFHQRGIRPDLIIFADVGAERPATYRYLKTMNEWCISVGFPEITQVRYVPKNFKHFPPYRTLEENILTNVSLPSIAYGGHTCSAKWKVAPINRFIDNWKPARDCWSAGLKVRKCIGFEDSPHERRRAQRGCATFAEDLSESSLFELHFPLQDWHWNLDRCLTEIKSAGLPVPQKSSCYFCTAMKPWEVRELEPPQLRRLIVIEARTAARHLKFAKEKGWPRGEGIPLTEGLWRRRVQGFRGATPKPGSMTEFIRDEKLLPADEIQRIIDSTPTGPLSQTDFTAAGFSDWQHWLQYICEPDETPIAQTLLNSLEQQPATTV